MKLEPFTTFIAKHHVLTIATSFKNTPWVASCFYVFDAKSIRFIIASSPETRHLSQALKNPKIAGNIYLETKEIGKIEGLQFSGELQKAKAKEKKLYFSSYPYALALQPNIWALHVSYMKLTDNRLGFGKKLEFIVPDKTIN